MRFLPLRNAHLCEELSPSLRPQGLRKKVDLSDKFTEESEGRGALAPSSTNSIKTLLSPYSTVPRTQGSFSSPSHTFSRAQAPTSSSLLPTVASLGKHPGSFSLPPCAQSALSQLLWLTPLGPAQLRALPHRETSHRWQKSPALCGFFILGGLPA